MHRYINSKQLLNLCSSITPCPVENEEQAELVISCFELSGSILEMGRVGNGLYAVTTDQNGTRREKISIDDVINQACEMNYEYSSLKKESLVRSTVVLYESRQIDELYKEYTNINRKEHMLEGIFKKTSYQEKTNFLLYEKYGNSKPIPKRMVSR